MGEVQKHGKVWEKHIFCGAYGYTAAKDLPAQLNNLNGVAISV